jgi:hypothetical protein
VRQHLRGPGQQGAHHRPVSSVPPFLAGIGTRVPLAPSGPYCTEDFWLLYAGTVAALYSDGIAGPEVGQTWPADHAYKYEYAPKGHASGVCIGTAVTTANGAPVTPSPAG